MNDMISRLVGQLASRLLENGHRITTAESCTGGLIAKTLTDLPGSSGWFERGFITYSNTAKVEMLAVPAAEIETHGAVSQPVVRAMARGALLHSRADYSVAVTGIAGPDGGSAGKPVGTVWVAVASSARCKARQHCFAGDRNAVREATLRVALQAVLELMDNK